MPAFNALTPDEQATLLAYMPVARGSLIAMAKALNTVQDMDSVWNSNVKAIVAKLDAGVVIPDVTGLAGAQSLTSTDINTIMTALETMLGTNNSQAWRTYYVRAGGVTNTMQSA